MSFLVIIIALVIFTPLVIYLARKKTKGHDDELK